MGSENKKELEDQLQSLAWTQNKQLNNLKILTTCDQKMDNNIVDKLKLFTDLNDDGNVDIIDYQLGLKYFAVIYSGLIAVMYALIGEDIDVDSLKSNIYFIIVFAVIAMILTFILVITKKKVGKKEKEISRLKTINTDQAAMIYANKLNEIEINHKHELEKIDLEFQLKIKDKIVQEKL